MTPKRSTIRQDDTHRLIPSRPGDQSVLQRLAQGAGQLEELFELEGATNDRLLGEANLLPGISVHELLFGVPYAHIVNAAFCHAHPGLVGDGRWPSPLAGGPNAPARDCPHGRRFNGPERGAWYAAFDLATARAEIAFHKSQELREINWREPETFTLDDYLADFRADFHDIRRDPAYAESLNPKSYAASQTLARDLLASGSSGIAYPSIRRTSGTCIVCFRPALVSNVRKGHSHKITVTF